MILKGNKKMPNKQDCPHCCDSVLMLTKWNPIFFMAAFHQEHTNMTQMRHSPNEEWTNVWESRCPGHIQWVSWHSRITWLSKYWRIQGERESGSSCGHQPPFPECRDKLPPPVVHKTSVTIIPSLLLKLQPSLWHMTFFVICISYSMMWKCPACRQLRARILSILSYHVPPLGPLLTRAEGVVITYT